MVGSWVEELLARVPPEDRDHVLYELGKIADDLIGRDYDEVGRDASVVLEYISLSDMRIDIDVPSSNARITVFRYDDAYGPHSAIVVIYTVNGGLEYAAVYHFY